MTMASANLSAPPDCAKISVAAFSFYEKQLISSRPHLTWSIIIKTRFTCSHKITPHTCSHKPIFALNVNKRVRKLVLHLQKQKTLWSHR